MTDEMTYRPMVADMDMTISRNIALVNKSLNVAPLCLSAETCCTPLIVKNTAANWGQPTTKNNNQKPENLGARMGGQRTVM